MQLTSFKVFFEINRSTGSNFLIILIMIVFSIYSHAVEEGSSSGGTSGVAEDPAFQEVITKLNMLESSINSKRGEIKNLIKMKNSNKKMPGENGENTTLQALQSAYDDLQRLEKDYEEKKKQAKYRFPAQGRLIERRYFPVGSKTLEELEVEVGLDGDLTRVKNKIVKKYKTFLPADEVEKEAIKEKEKFDAKKENTRISLER